MIILRTKRLLLRHLDPGDVDALDAIYRDPDVRRYIPDCPNTRAETEAEVEWHRHGHPRRPELGLWATIDRDGSRLIGRCGLLPWTIDDREEVEVAYLLEKASWGRGLASEAARGLVDHAFRTLRLPRLICLVESGNAASIRVAEKAGMRFEKEGADAMGPFLLYAQANPATT